MAWNVAATLVLAVAAPSPARVQSACSGAKFKAAAAAATGTRLDCPPRLIGFQASLPTVLNPLAIGTVSVTSAAGNFCPGQNDPGAFGQMSTVRARARGYSAWCGCDRSRLAPAPAPARAPRQGARAP